ncbi:MAG: hypothetical protein OXU81_05840 [Gammaproteobacteria bacterium]|nr:hypothetical protein [Gammaproteobacteria bacterium]
MSLSIATREAFKEFAAAIGAAGDAFHRATTAPLLTDRGLACESELVNLLLDSIDAAHGAAIRSMRTARDALATRLHESTSERAAIAREVETATAEAERAEGEAADAEQRLAEIAA